MPLSRPLEREKILRLSNAAQRIAADGDQPVLLRAKRREEGGRGEDLQYLGMDFLYTEPAASKIKVDGTGHHQSDPVADL